MCMVSVSDVSSRDGLEPYQRLVSVSSRLTEVSVSVSSRSRGWTSWFRSRSRVGRSRAHPSHYTHVWHLFDMLTCCDGNVSSKSFKTEYVDNLCTFQTRIRHIVIKTFFQRRSSSTHLEGILNTVAHVFDTLWYNRTSNVAIMHAQGWWRSQTSCWRW